MSISCVRAVAAASLLAASLSATAASAVVEAYLLTRDADNVLNPPGCTTGSTTLSECVHSSQNSLGLSVLGTGTLTTLRSTFDAGNTTQVPNFVMNGVGYASAGLGHLHAYTFVQIQGKGGNNVTIGGRSFAQLSDRVTITSSVLPAGTPVTLRALMDVGGHGGGKMYFGINQFVQQVDVASDFGGDTLDDYETTFSAKVGDRVTVTYGLVAYTRMFSTVWTPTNVLNGRNNTADYGNSAYIYMGGVDPSLGITLVSDTGYVYAAVPEPAAAWLLLAGLPWLARRGRSRGEEARG